MAAGAEQLLVKIAADVSSLKKGLNEGKKEVGSFTDEVGKLTTAMGVAFGAKEVFDFFKASIDAAGEAELVSKKLEQALRAQGLETTQTMGRVDALSKALQRQSKFSDEAITEAQTLLIQLGRLSGDGLDQATRATLDLAAGLKIDLNTAALLMGKAAGGATETLSRYGLIVTKTGDTAKDFASVLAQVNERFGGQAQAEIETYAGQVEQLKNEFNELQEILGAKMLPTVKHLAQDLIELSTASRESSNAGAAAEGAWSAVADSFRGYLAFTTGGLSELVRSHHEARDAANEHKAAQQGLNEVYGPKIDTKFHDDLEKKRKKAAKDSEKAARDAEQAERDRLAVIDEEYEAYQKLIEFEEAGNAAWQKSAEDVVKEIDKIIATQKKADDKKIHDEKMERQQQERESAQQTQRVYEDMGYAAAEAFASYASGAENSEEKTKRLTAAMVELIVKLLVMKALESQGMNPYAAGQFGSIAGGAAGSATYNSMHDGGVVGAHGGYKVGGSPGRDKVPIMAERGERVLTREQNAEWERGGSGGGSVVVNINSVLPPDPAQFRQVLRDHFVPALADLQRRRMA